MRILGIIPARYQSARLEGKPLLDIAGKPMIQRVYEQTCKAMSDVCIATDDTRIYDVAKRFGATVIMTSDTHTNGTSRCLEAVNIINSRTQKKYQFIVNIQGDEPLIDPLQIKELINCFGDSADMVTLVMKVKNNNELQNASECFVVINQKNEAMYFSRTPIPHVKDVEQKKWLNHHHFYKHIGLYGYTYNALNEFSNMSISSLEKVESLEQNRWLQAGKIIKVGYTNFETIPVDTIEDLERVRRILSKN